MAESILDKIIEAKTKEVEERKELYPIKLLEKSISFCQNPVSMKEYLLREDRVGVIAEIKRQSPSKGPINPHISVEELSIGYMQAGASALSVLTDTEFFGGSLEDLRIARKYNYCPILRKDFIVDEYQLVEAKSAGADVILLIAAALSPRRIRMLASEARQLGLEVLMEVHTKEELERSLCPEVDIVGVNNRDLNDFSVSFERSLELSESIPSDYIKISESGLSEPKAILKLRRSGFRGFLIGEAFMKSAQPHLACKDFIASIVALTEEVV